MNRSGLWIILAALIVCTAVAQEQALAPPDWETLRAVYDYDPSAPLEVQHGESSDAGAFTAEQFSFLGADGERVPALLLRPKNVPRPPVVLFLHGLGGDKDQARLAAMLLAPRGIAVMAIDARLHGDRAVEGPGIGAQLAAEPTALQRTVVDNRRAIDYIHTRDDLDAERVALVGASMGAILGSITAAVDRRIDAAALLVGGAGWAQILATSEHPAAEALREAGFADPGRLAAIEPANFVGHISPRPVLMVNGEQDRIIPPSAARALHAAANEPKTIIWYEGGHVDFPPDVLAQFAQWIEDRLASASDASQPIP